MQKVERKHFNNWQLHFRTITADDSFAIAVAQRYATVLAVLSLALNLCTAVVVVIIVGWIILVQWQNDVSVCTLHSTNAKRGQTLETFNGAQWCDYYLCSQAAHC